MRSQGERGSAGICSCSVKVMNRESSKGIHILWKQPSLLHVLWFLLQAESITPPLNNCFRQMLYLGCSKYHRILPIPFSSSCFSLSYHLQPTILFELFLLRYLFIFWSHNNKNIIYSSLSYINLSFCFLYHIFQTRFFF